MPKYTLYGDGIHDDTKALQACIDEVKDGGTVVVTKKMYFGGNYTWNANGPVTITSNYGGVNYINKSPLTNPASGVLKFKPNVAFTVARRILWITNPYSCISKTEPQAPSP